MGARRTETKNVFIADLNDAVIEVEQFVVDGELRDITVYHKSEDGSKLLLMLDDAEGDPRQQAIAIGKMLLEAAGEPI